jgi:peptidoglycan/LPS O-acetylase OafA/YrhL
LANGPFGYWFSWSLGAWLADSYLKNEPLPLSNFLLTPFLWLSAASYLILPLNPFFFLLVAVTTSITLSKVLSGQKWFSIPELGKTCLKKISLWSYSIYLVHMPIIMVCSLILVRIIPAQTRTYPVVMLLLTALWPLIFLVSVAWHKIFELPGIAFGKRIIANVSSRNTAAKGSA